MIHGKYMDNFWQYQVVINLIIQNWGDWLAPVMRFLSSLGQVEFYILVLPILYWVFDAGLAVRFTFLLVLSGFSNAFLKITFHAPRPYWLDTRVKAFANESSFGLPSGHAQNAATLGGYITTLVNSGKLKALVFTLVFLIGFSRIYLGVHFLSDVVAGWVIGGFLLLLFIGLEKKVVAWFSPQAVIWKTVWMVILSLFIIILMVGWLSVQSMTPVPLYWVANIKNLAGIIYTTPYSADDTITFSGVFLGMMLGNMWLNQLMKYNPASGTLRQKLGRIFLGFLGLLAIVYGINAIFPASSDFPGQILRFSRFGFASLWISFLAPFLFKKWSLL